MTDFVLFEREDGDRYAHPQPARRAQRALDAGAMGRARGLLRTGSCRRVGEGCDPDRRRNSVLGRRQCQRHARQEGHRGRQPVRHLKGYQGGIQRIPLALHQLEVPTIAAVNGPAIGAGCDLACMCDIRIASDQAKFAESFVKLGIIPGDGGAWLLQRAIGYQRAAELTFTGDAIDAQAALAMGLVTRVVAPEALMPSARELAARIAANSGAGAAHDQTAAQAGADRAVGRNASALRGAAGTRAPHGGARSRRGRVLCAARHRAIARLRSAQPIPRGATSCATP